MGVDYGWVVEMRVSGERGLRFDPRVANEIVNVIFLAGSVLSLVQTGNNNYQTRSNKITNNYINCTPET